MPDGPQRPSCNRITDLFCGGVSTMAEITADAVKALRERTDLPMMECKKALIEAGGDQDKAVQILKERVKGLKLKVADRPANEGRIPTLTAPDGLSAAMVEVQCESAPVAKGED